MGRGGSENMFQWSTTLQLIQNRHWICLSMNIIPYILSYPPRNISYVIIDAPSPLTFSPSSFCLSGSTPVRLLMDCFRSITVSSSDRELMEYSWPPHLMITDTDMAHTRALHTQTHTLGRSWRILNQVFRGAQKVLTRCIQLQRHHKTSTSKGKRRITGDISGWYNVSW